MPHESLAKNFVRKDLPESEVEFVGEIPHGAFAEYKDRALKHAVEHLELPGFRKGHVPAEMARKHVGDMRILEEAVELFVKDFYPVLISSHAIDAVGRPDIKVTKLAPDNPVGLTVRASVYPEVQVPRRWKEFHKDVPLETALPATDEEVQKTLDSLQQSRARREEGKELVLPELNDEFAKSVGSFENLDALKTQIRKGIGEEKERAARDTRRGKLIEKLVDEAEVAVPRVFIESEQEKILTQMREDVKRFGMEFTEYLKRAGKTEDAVRQEFRAQAEKRAKLQLVLNKLAQEEKVEVDKEAVEHELKHAIEHFPDANPELVRIHIETVLRNEKVLKLLEGSPQN